MKVLICIFISFSFFAYAETFELEKVCLGKEHESHERYVGDCSLVFSCRQSKGDVLISCKDKGIFYSFDDKVLHKKERVTTVRYDSSSSIFLTTILHNTGTLISRVIKGVAERASRPKELLAIKDGVYSFDKEGRLILKQVVKCSRPKPNLDEKCFEEKRVNFK